MQELLDVVAAESPSRVERRGDEFGYEWLIIQDNDFEELIKTVHLVASELVARGFGEQLLAAVFRFERLQAPAVPDLRLQARGVLAVHPEGRDKERDNAEELELKAKLEKELPIEQDLSRWLALFDAPI